MKIEIKNWEELDKLPINKTIKAIINWEDGSTEERRIENERLVNTNEKTIFIYSKGSKKYGERRHSLKGIKSIIAKIETEEDEKNKWIKSWEKVVKMLEKSGLWENLLKKIKLGLEIGYEKLKMAAKLWLDDENKIYEIDERIKEIEDFFYYMSKPAKIKKMYFGKEKNKEILERIKEAIKNKKTIEEYASSNYDVSFVYRPEQNKAFYSEEYKGLGNGHYYLALNETHALFYEDD